jgi:hypothetical protein
MRPRKATHFKWSFHKVERRIKDMRHDNATGYWQIWGRDRVVETARGSVDGLANDPTHQLKNDALVYPPSGGPRR